MSSYKEKMRKKIEEKGGNISGSLNDLINKPSESIEPSETFMNDAIPNTLEEIESQIHSLKGKTYEISWLIGKRLIEIKNNHLEKTGYKDFKEYVEDKFEFTRVTAYRFMFIAENFDRVTSKKHGSKLTLLMGLEKNEIQNYLEWFDKDNPTNLDIADKIKSKNKPSPGRPPKEITYSNKNGLIRSFKVDLGLMKIDIQKDHAAKFKQDLESFCKNWKPE